MQTLVFGEKLHTIHNHLATESVDFKEGKNALQEQ